MTIGRREIGADQPVFVIAEIGVNHDGSVERAVELVRHAVAAGADAVKVQVFTAAALVHRSSEFAEYQKIRVAAAHPAEMLLQYELPFEAIAELANAVANAGLEFVATPFSPSDVATVARYATAVKIASPDLVNRLLLSDVIVTKRPLLVSTGAATADEILAAAAWLKQHDADFALLHCVSHYPVAAADTNLKWIGELARFGVPVGYSDHATDPDAGALAVACGACFVEKHLTYDTTAAGPDHSASLDPAGFADYVRRIRKTEQLLGRGGPRRVLDCEQDVRRVSRQSMVAVRDLPAGHLLAAEDLTTQRPGTGLSAVMFEDALRRPLTRAVRAGDMLLPQDVAFET